MKAIEIIFWIFLFIVFYTYLGYGILLYFLVKIKEFVSKPKQMPYSSDSELPDITLLIAAYNEEDIVKEKMANIMMLEYPSVKLKVLWVTDGSTDGTNSLLAEYDNVEILYEAKRSGKTAAINRAMSFIHTPIVVFTDANTMLNCEALTHLVKAFSNPKVGCVAGEKRIAQRNKDKASIGGESIYWKYESSLKALDSRLKTTCGAAGELFAIKRVLFEDIETDTLLDDFMLSMRIAKRGFKIEYTSDAYAIEEGSCNMTEEKKRKVRIAAGGVQSVWRLRGLLNPFKFPLLSFQYISHRVLRWTITPFLLFLLLPLNLSIVLMGNMWIYKALLIFHIIFYLIAIIGMKIKKATSIYKYLIVPYYFFFMNFNVINGFFYLLKKKKGDGTWEKAKRAA